MRTASERPLRSRPLMRCATATGSMPVNSRAMSRVSSCETTSEPKMACCTRTGPNSAAFCRIAWRIGSEAVTVKDGQIEGVDRTADRGVGVRVIVDGAWGFAASDRAASDDQLAALFGEAIHRAEAAATVHRAPVALAAQDPQRGAYRTL